jgi:hypothetical protein
MGVESTVRPSLALYNAGEESDALVGSATVVASETRIDSAAFVTQFAPA